MCLFYCVVNFYDEKDLWYILIVLENGVRVGGMICFECNEIKLNSWILFDDSIYGVKCFFLCNVGFYYFWFLMI